jgi:hypothetical protein
MNRFDDDALFAELRAVRPTPRPEFAAELDERAAAGFPRRSAPSAAATPFARLADRWRALSPRRRLMPVLAIALAALVVATGVVAIAGRSGPRVNVDMGNEAVVGMVPGARESGMSAEETSGTSSSAAPARPHAAHHGGVNSGAGGGGERAGETVYSPEVPSVESESAGTNKAAGAAAEEGAGAGDSAGVEEGSSEATFTPEVPSVENFTTGHRDIERSAYVVLGTKPGEVAGAAAKVYEAVHAANGVVLHSSVKSGSAGATGASFELLIPSSKIDDALASFSQIAEVRERHDATNDITKQTVGAGEELADSNATIESLLKQLGDAETEAERESLETRLREERRRHAAIKTSLDHLHKRASMSEVSVRIVTDHGAGVVPAGKGSDDGWSVGDALHDAGQILTIAAGIVLVALAVLAPIALIALLAWFANRVRVRRLRERTLG